jgi:hypothetical protein
MNWLRKIIKWMCGCEVDEAKTEIKLIDKKKKKQEK